MVSSVNSEALVEINPRSVCKSSQQALWFNNFIDLSRMSQISSLSFSNQVDWSATWSLLHHFPDVSKSQTSFAQSRHFVFASKLFLNELPLLEYLRLKRDDLYHDFPNCVRCLQAPETWSHFIRCQENPLSINEFISDISHGFIEVITPHLSSSSISSASRDILSLDCWKLDSDPADFSFELLLRGFVPQALTDLLRRYNVSPVDISNSLNFVFSSALTRFHDEFWVPRCNVFMLFEKMAGITGKMKRSPSRPTSQSHSSSRAQPASSKWRLWIAQSVLTGNPWQDFQLRINCFMFIVELLLHTGR
jgi:hypothetical protein